MFYHVKKRPVNISFEFLDEVFTFAEYFLGFDENLMITIDFKLLDDNVYGYAEPEDIDEYIIEVHSYLTEKDVVRTIFHELIHVKQFLDGKLDEDGMTWMGIKYKSTSMPYHELPWEEEAHRVEGLMSKEFFQGR